MDLETAIPRPTADTPATHEPAAPSGIWKQARPAIPFVLVGVCTAGIAIGCLFALRGASDDANQIYDRTIAGLDIIGELQYQTQEARRRMLYALSTTDPNLQVRYADESREPDTHVSALLTKHAQLDSKREASIRQTFARDWTQYLEIRDDVIALILEGRVAEAVRVDLRHGGPVFERLRADLQAFKTLHKEQAAQQISDVRSMLDRTGWLLVLIVTAVQALAVVAVRRAQQARMLHLVRESESRLQDVVSSISEGMLAVDDRGRVVLWNRAMEGVTGRERITVLGKPLGEVLPEIDALTFASHAAGEPTVVPDVRLASVGQERIFEARLFPFWGGTTAFLNDISERKRLEDQLRQSQKMEAIGRLAGGVAHDFNNLLTVIIGYGGVLSARITDPECAADIDEILRAGESAARLTRQLLAFSRQQVMQPQIIDLNEVIGTLQKMLCRITEEDVSIVWFPAPRPCWVKADPGQVEQVILNLAVNARDAMPRGGQLTVATRIVELSEEVVARHTKIPPGRYSRVTMQDTGSGMDELTMSRVFEPFFTTKGTKGTGLGLSTVFGIVTQSQGYIDLDSTPGCGTTFDVYLPESDAPAVVKTAPSEATVNAADATVLLVEDDHSVRSLIAGQLKRAGYSMIAAASPLEALEIVRDHKQSLDVLLTDMVMPEMDGWTLATEVEAVRPALRRVFMSGYTEHAAFRPEVLAREVFLQKPFTSATLLRKIQDALAGPSGSPGEQPGNLPA